MRKGQKLVNAMRNKIGETIKDSDIVRMIYYMDDGEFDKITKGAL